MIRFTCPQCRKSVRVPDAFAGKKGRCPFCKAVAAIPSAGRPPPASEALESLTAALGTSESGEEPTTPPPPPPPGPLDQPPSQEAESEILAAADPSHKTERLEAIREDQPSAPAQAEGAGDLVSGPGAGDMMPRTGRGQRKPPEAVVIGGGVLLAAAVAAGVVWYLWWRWQKPYATLPAYPVSAASVSSLPGGVPPAPAVQAPQPAPVQTRAVPAATTRGKEPYLSPDVPKPPPPSVPPEQPPPQPTTTKAPVLPPRPPAPVAQVDVLCTNDLCPTGKAVFKIPADTISREVMAGTAPLTCPRCNKPTAVVAVKCTNPKCGKFFAQTLDACPHCGAARK